MRRNKEWLFGLFVLLLPLIMFAQEVDPSFLTLDRIFNSLDFRQQRFGPVKWMSDGSGYTTIEESGKDLGGKEIVKYDPQSGKRTILIPVSKLVQQRGGDVIEIEDYTWSSDMKKVLIFTNTKRVWRQNTRGDYWVLDIESSELHKLGGNAEPSTLMFAKFSPDGRSVGYVRENNIYVEDIESGKIKQLTFDGSETLINGTFDWVYEEEFSCRDGFRWSPDGKKIAYWQLDSEGVGTFFMINNTDSIYPRLIPIRYPKVGTTNSSCRVGVLESSGGETIWIGLNDDPRNHYIPRMKWSVDSKHILIQHLNRLQNRNEVILCDPENGDTRIVFIDTDDRWVDVCDDVEWIDDGKSFIFVSEKDRWRHIYIVSINGNVRCVTQGDYDVVSVEAVDKKEGWIYFIASPDDPKSRYLYRIKMSGGDPERLTPEGMDGNHQYQISPDCRWAIHTYSAMDTPPVIDLVTLPDHNRVRILVENKRLHENFEALKRVKSEFFRVDIGDGTVLDGWMIKPWNFDSSKRYPVLFYVYGEPWGQTVQDRWGGERYLWHLMLAQHGYIVMSIDNRGTPCPRGREWRKAIYGKIGILNISDQAAALKEIKKWDFVDGTRIGVWGWSGGGSSILNLMFQYPDLYHVGMAVAPVADQLLYDTIYQERYMGLVSHNPERFKNGSPISYAQNLKGDLLIVHGTGDDNVHYQGTEKLINELVKYNKQFSVMIYPNRSHGIYEGKNTRVHLFGLLTKYLEEHLPAGGR